jgi:hypothetical protein
MCANEEGTKKGSNTADFTDLHRVKKGKKKKKREQQQEKILGFPTHPELSLP